MDAGRLLLRRGAVCLHVWPCVCGHAGEPLDVAAVFVLVGAWSRMLVYAACKLYHPVLYVVSVDVRARQMYDVKAAQTLTAPL